MNNIGFFGGTFNPIHIGHIRMGVEVFEKTALDHIHFVPAAIPPHKKVKGLLDFDKRVHLINLAFQEYKVEDIFSVSLHESTMQGPSYTYFSLQLWQEIYKKVPYFILGLEDFLQLSLWHNGLDLPKFCNFIVVKRAHYKEEDFHLSIERYWGKEALQNSANKYSIFGNSLEYLETSRLDISSTKIRNAVLENSIIAGLVPEKVRYTIENNDDIKNKWAE